MEGFILRIIALVCSTLVVMTIVIARKDDIEITSIVFAVILEVLSLIIIFFPESLLISIVSKYIL